MAIRAPEPGTEKTFEPIPQGPQAAICDMIVDLGLQDTNFGVKHQVYIRWQVPDFRVTWEKDGEEFDKPGIVGNTYTLSMSEKSNLRPLLESWRGKVFDGEEIRNFDITKLAGVPCLLNIVHNKGTGLNSNKTYANISSIMPLPKSMPVPKAESDIIVYDDDNRSTFDVLPEWLQKKIEGQKEVRDDPISSADATKSYATAGTMQQDQQEFAPASAYDDDSDIPF